MKSGRPVVQLNRTQCYINCSSIKLGLHKAGERRLESAKGKGGAQKKPHIRCRSPLPVQLHGGASFSQHDVK